MLTQTISQNKQIISDYLTNYLKNQQKSFSTHSWSKDVFNRLIPFATAGKMIRGSMSLIVNELFGNFSQADSVKVAAAIELYQAGLLIHDDIMDQDEARRGQTSIYAQYKQLANKNNFHNSRQFGEGCGICVGDLCLFLIFDLLSRANLEPQAKNKLYSTFACELAKLTLGQMKDLELANTTTEISEDDILQMYVHKTSRYTFSLPFMSGAILAKQNKNLIQRLADLGDIIGLIFQIKDDEIGLFGNTQKTGKPAGNDIREAKKTLFWYHLLKNAQKDNKTKLEKLFGKTNINTEEIEFVKSQIVKTGTRKIIEAKLKQLSEQASESIQQIDNQKAQQFFRELIEFNLRRKK